MRVGINTLFHASGGSLTNLLQLIEEWKLAGNFATHELVFFLSAGMNARLDSILPATAERVVLPFATASAALVRLAALAAFKSPGTTASTMFLTSGRFNALSISASRSFAWFTRAIMLWQ